ncbi:DUF2267 domain-containing protein [Streptomyces sp. Ru71]|uniref:DUF2267 domain-containing protein n=1 Tax=Streptomyces sp. Ru71 TaxID=2080746 RepID=UPI0015E37B4E|nr:DUF2267 domain-containing protein [Streptomyces sp. Ru71]
MTTTVPNTTTLKPTTTPLQTKPPMPPRPRQATATTTATDSGWFRLIDAVKEAGQYPTRGEAESITRIVLSALGGQVVGEERVALAQALPREAAVVVASQIPATRRLTAAAFVDSVATRIEGATPATARWDVSSVLSVLPPLLGEDLTNRLLSELPPGYALLFGRADLIPPQ